MGVQNDYNIYSKSSVRSDFFGLPAPRAKSSIRDTDTEIASKQDLKQLQKAFEKRARWSREAVPEAA